MDNAVSNISLEHFIAVGAIVFGLGLFGLVFNHRHLIKTLLSIELMLLGINLTFLTFGLYHKTLVGQLCSIFILAIGAAEVAIGISILIVYYRQKHAINIIDLRELKG